MTASIGPLAGVSTKRSPGSTSASNSISFDHSAVDEARQARAKAAATDSEAFEAAYKGDIGAAANAAGRIRALRNQAAAADRIGVRVSSKSNSASQSGTGTSNTVEYHKPSDQKTK